VHECHLNLTGTFRVTHYVILNVILYAFYEPNDRQVGVFPQIIK